MHNIELAAAPAVFTGLIQSDAIALCNAAATFEGFLSIFFSISPSQ